MNIFKTWKSLLRWLPALAILSISWYLSSQETVERMPSFWNADKLVHLVCFGGLSFWLSFGGRTEKAIQGWIPTALTSLYGIIDEIHQSFVPGRSSTIGDWIADTAGGILGAFVFIWFCRAVKIFITRRKESTK